MSKEAMKLALEALEESVDLVREDYENAKKLYENYPSRQKRLMALEDGLSKHEQAITALREAQAEQPAQQQEPVARIAELEETVRHLNHALREATEAPTFMGEPVYDKPAQQDLPNLIAGALGVSRGTAYDMMREALAEQPAPVQQKPETKDVVIANMGDPFTVKAYVIPQPAQQQLAATITISQRGPVHTIDNHFEDCVRGWPNGEYKLYTSPPAQRTWVGLTDGKGVLDFEGNHVTPQFAKGALWAEAKLQEKNT